ncbi:MAG TPA: adenylate/guanylate cyclase domain-containing protein [Anaerolineales bacterium]|nr:adenylate/guanylate cyclase domain-containing protein [Anaerolineales bacterium]
MDTQDKALPEVERALLERSIAALEAKRSELGDEIPDVALAAMLEKLSGGQALRVPQQRKLVTVLFADVSGFTAMSETMDHEVVNDVINSLWSRVDKAIQDQGGRIDKHIGDAVMALYGTPTAREDDSERAMRSALKIQSEIQDWKSEQSERLPDYKTQIQNIQLRIGINSGIALLGTVGTVGEYTAIGDTVKLANWLESAAPRGGILISHDAYQHVRGIFDVTPLEPMVIKGRSKPIQVYTVNGVTAHSSGDTTRGPESVETHALDRKKEFERAIAALESKRSLLGDEVVDTALKSMLEKLAELNAGGRRALRVPQQRKLVTILFADVSGFTAMFEKMDPEAVNNVIDSLWSRVDKAIQDHGGRIDKHINDVLMALYGIPTAHEDDPERAMRSALQIQSEIQIWKKEQIEALPSYKAQIKNIQLRIGINTGPALLGTVGTVGEYTAIGDTVNLAQRLEASAPPGGILISRDAHQHVRGIFDVTALEPIKVKGKSEPIQVYTVNGVKPRSFRDTTRGLEGVETRTVGREEELKQMQAAFERVASERLTYLINLIAEAGTGKSRVLFEFGKWLDTLGTPVQIFKGRAAQEISQIPYSLWRGIISSAFEIQENDRAALARQKLERGVQRYTRDPEVASLYAHFIGHLIGLDYSNSRHLKGILSDARQVRDRAFHYAAEFIADIAHDHTVVIFLEDIHWADSGSLDFFDALMRKQPDLPLLIVGLTRSSLFEQRPDWGTGPIQHLNLNLLPLSDADTRLLVLEILQKVPDVPEVLIDLIVKKAEGSPFYVEELIKVLIEGGVIVRGAERWSVKLDRLSNLKVPATLTGLLQARLDSLRLDARETLQQASVVGRVFWMDIIERMHDPDYQTADASSQITEKLGVLHAKELIFRYEESGSKDASEFIFKNQILHDVTYESVLLRLRPVYHGQAADGLVEMGGERANEYAGRVGEHYERAGEWLKAAEWYARAGRQAQNTYSSETALNYYEKALKYFNDYGGPQQVNQKLEVCYRLGEVLNWQARYGDAFEIFNMMLKYAEENEDVVAQARALQGMGISQTYQGDHLLSLDNAMRAEVLARRADDKALIARALLMQGQARWRLGVTQAALALDEQALAIYTELNSKNDMATSMNLLGGAHYTSGRFDQAEEYWENALKIFQELGNRQMGMELMSNLGVIAEARGDYETAFQRYDSALTISREVGYRDGEILFITNRGSAQVALKNYGAAEADLRQAISLAGVTGSWCMPLAFNYRAEALLGLNRSDEAFYSARQALVLAEEDKTPEYIGMAWRTLGMICGRINDVIRFSDWETHQVSNHDAETCFSKSVQILTEADIDSERARTLREWARYEFTRGNREQGQKMWQEAREIFTRLGAQKEADRMNELPA